MSTKDTSEPAFPCGTDVTQGQFAPACGMSLRDYFAAKAMQGWLASYPDTAEASAAEKGSPIAAKLAYVIADAMLIARKT